MPTRSLLAAAILAACVVPAAQQRPDLSGTWTADAGAPPGLPAAPSPVFGPQFELRQDANALTVVRPVRDTLVTTALTLDGRESRTRMPGPLCQGDAQTTETAVWEGEAIALTMVGLMSPGSAAPTRANVRRVFGMLTSITADAATFENPSHDYPKLIRYTKKPDGSLETTIAGEGGQRAQSVVLNGR